MSRVRRKEGPKTNSRIPRKSKLIFEILKPQQIGGVEELSTNCRALMNLVIQSVGPNHFNKELLKYIYL